MWAVGACGGGSSKQWHPTFPNGQFEECHWNSASGKEVHLQGSDGVINDLVQPKPECSHTLSLDLIDQQLGAMLSRDIKLRLRLELPLTHVFDCDAQHVQ